MKINKKKNMVAPLSLFFAQLPGTQQMREEDEVKTVLGGERLQGLEATRIQGFGNGKSQGLAFAQFTVRRAVVHQMTGG